MKIKIHVELQESEIGNANSIADSLRSLGDEVAVCYVTDKSSLSKSITESVKDGNTELLVSDLTRRLTDERLKQDCINVFCDVLFDIERCERGEPSEPYVALMQRLPEATCTLLFTEVIQRAVEFLSMQRRHDCSRAPLVPYAEVIACLTKVGLLNVDSAMTTIVQMIRVEYTQSAGIVCLGKIAEIALSRVMENCEKSVLSTARELVTRLQQDPVFLYDAEYITNAFGWSSSKKTFNFGICRSMPYHKVPILSLAYCNTPSRDMVVTSSKDGTIATWDGLGNLTATVMLARHYAASVDIANQGRALVVAADPTQSSNAPAIVLYREEGRYDKTQWMENSAVEPRGAQIVTAVRTLRNATSLSYCCTVSGATHSLMYYDNVDMLHDYQGHTEVITALHVATDRDNLAATGSRDRTVRMYDLRLGSPTASLAGNHNDTVTSIVSTGDFLLSAGLDGKIVAYDLRMMSAIGVARELESQVLSMSMGPNMVCAAATLNGIQLISFGNRTTLACRADTGKNAPRYNSIAWNAPGNVLYAGGDSYTLDVLARSQGDSDRL